jgi:hypothetical protein
MEKTMDNQITIDNRTYQLPEPLTASYLAAAKSLVILKPDAKSTVFSGRTIIASVDLKGHRSDKEKTAQAERLLVRHGAKIVGETPIPSVA